MMLLLIIKKLKQIKLLLLNKSDLPFYLNAFTLNLCKGVFIMKRFAKIFLLLVLFYSTKTKAQNLVPNPSFERADESLPCPRPDSLFAFNPNTEAIPWIELASADYFHSCATLYYVSIPSNRFGFQYPHFGQGYTGLIAYDYTSLTNREYIEVELLTLLLPSQTYYVQFYASLADTMQYAVSNLGALFTDTLFNPMAGPFPAGHPQAWNPQVENTSGNILNDKINWVAINGSFVANGGERFITIGNFRADAQTITQYVGGNTHPNTRGAYYFIDDVYVGTTPPVSINENEKNKFKVKVYPNPSNGNMTLEYSLKDNESGMFNLYNITGTLISSHPLQKNSQQLFINNDELEAGIYLYDVSINNKKVKTDKIVIIK